MKKIVITGGLGYIGSELCKIYSGYSWLYNIIVIDNRFISGRVNQLRKWNMKFFHADILDQELIKKLCHDADVVHHLAGITSVPRVASEANKEKEKEIEINAIEGTQNIINVIRDDCKIIMPSSHVVYESLKDVKLNIKEEEVTCPKLSYGKSKDANEKQLKNSGKNYIILRLGSVYGYSADATRLDIMTNLFCKLSSQNKTLKLFAGGRQIKSLISVFDVARCFKFMEERKDINYEIFNTSKDTVTVKKVSEICRKYNPKTKILETNDEVPNLGFSLSNKKLLKTGFKFLYSLDESIREMIRKLSKQSLIKEIEYIQGGTDEFVDSRGKISNFELTEPVNMIGLIESKKGTLRANHFHPQQEQKCLFTKGQIIEVFKDLLNPNSPKITQAVNAGQISIIKPNIAHTMIFSKDTTFLNLVRGEREHKNYGITHTIKHNFVDEKEKNLLLGCYKFECRSCGNNKLQRFISLGYQPLANNLLKKRDEKTDFYPLEVNYCDKCHNCQLSVAVDPKKMFSNYLYTSSTSKKFRDHFSKAATKYINEFKLIPNKSYIIDVGSNDGIALKPFKDKKFKRILGIDPAKNLSKLANKNNIKTFNGFLNNQNIDKIKKNADLVLASNVFAHSDDLTGMAKCMIGLLKKNGNLIIEVQYLVDTLKELTFDNIYHEHYNYWSLTSLTNFFRKLNTKIYRAEKINTHGGSLRIYLNKNKTTKVEKSVNKILKEEEKFGIKKFQTYKIFGEKINKIRENINKNLDKIINKNNNIIGYGSPAKATTFLNFFGINNKKLKYVIEDNILKQNKYIPGVKIKIVNKKKFYGKENTVLVLAWNFFEEIKASNKKLGDKFINIKDLEKNNL